MKTCKLLFPIFLILFSSIALAQTITIGVQPSEITLDFYKADIYNIQFNFFNEYGDTDAYYYLTPDKCLETIMQDYPKEILVPKGTKRLENPISTWIKFTSDNTGDKNCSLIIYALPVGSNETGTIKIKPSVAVKFMIYQSLEGQTTIPSSGSSSSSFSSSSGSSSSGSSRTSGSSTTSITIPNENNKIEKNKSVEIKIQGNLTTQEAKLWHINPVNVAGVILVALVGVAFFIWRKGIIFLIPLLIIPSLVKAFEVNATFNVTKVIIPPPPPPLEVVMLKSILPVLTAFGILLFTFKALIYSPKTVEEWLSVIVPIIVAIALLGILVII